MTRLLADASGVIALAAIGELDLMRDLVGEVWLTPKVLDEVLHPDHPEGSGVRKATKEGWLRVLPHRAKGDELAAFGLDPGEASLFLAAKPAEVILLDDRPARRVAEARGQAHLGLLGLLVAGVVEGKVSRDRGLAVLDQLAAGDFHMSVELYQRARTRMEAR